MGEAVSNSLDGKLLELLEAQGERIEWLTKKVTALNEHISVLYQELHDLAPEKEIIDLMAWDEAERKEMLSRYMNHGNLPEIIPEEKLIPEENSFLRRAQF